LDTICSATAPMRVTLQEPSHERIAQKAMAVGPVLHPHGSNSQSKYPTRARPPSDARQSGYVAATTYGTFDDFW
jgi:hypothetical protein